MKVNFENVTFTNKANMDIAITILNKINNDMGYREKEILQNLSEIEQNKEVPKGYIQYVFYDNKGDGFQAGKYANGSYGISL